MQHIRRGTHDTQYQETRDGARGERPSTGQLVAYWATTVALAAMMLSGSVEELTRQSGILETHTILGYPIYFLSIIGTWKALGAIAILVPGLPRLKEWAYAGMFFNMTGAFISHAAVGDYGVNSYHLIATGTIALLVVASWALRPHSRMLGTLLAAAPFGQARAAAIAK